MLDVKDKIFYSNVHVQFQLSHMDDCIRILGSTQESLAGRFEDIKEEFPNAKMVSLDTHCDYLRATVKLGEYKDGDDMLQKKIDDNNKKLRELGYDI